MLEVRLLAVEDAEAVTAAVELSRAHLTPWLPWAREPARSAVAQRAWIADRLREARGGGDETFGVFEAGELLGVCALLGRIGPGGLEIGYWTRVDATRRGVASFGARTLAERGLTRPSIARVEIRHDVRNDASGRVAAAAGFTWVEDRPAVEDGEPRTERVWRRVRGGGAT